MNSISHSRLAERSSHGVHTIAREVSGFNGWLAVKITNIVGTMWCAYAFTGLALVSLPDAIRAAVAWFRERGMI